MAALRVLSVTHDLGSNSAFDWRVTNVARQLQRLGNEVGFFDYSKLVKRSCLIPKYLSIASSLDKITNLYKPNLIYGNSHLPTLYCTQEMLRRVPIVFDMHGGLLEENRWIREETAHASRLRDALDWLVDIVSSTAASMIICVSRKMMTYLNEMKGIPFSKMIYATNGVDLNRFNNSAAAGANMRRRLGIGAELVFGYAGGSQVWQGKNTLIKAGQESKDEQVRIVLAGDDSPRKTGRLVVLPRLSREELVNFYSMCNVLVLPRPDTVATQIAAPTKFSEYLSMSKPVMTTNVGDAGRLVGEHGCGYIIETTQKSAFLDGLEWFKSRSEHDLILMGRNSRRLAETEFDWNKIGQDLSSALVSRFGV